MKISFLVFTVLFIFCFSCNPKEETKPYLTLEAPKAKQIAKELTTHGDTRIDNYFWMRLSDGQKNAKTPDQQTQDVINYLNAENEYLDKAMAHTDALQDTLYNEIINRIKKDDQSVPINKKGYSYYSRFETGADYALYCRKKIQENAIEEIMLNGPELAKGFSYYGFGSQSISPDNKVLAYGVDTVSRRQYTIFFKNLETGETLKDELENTEGRATWANDGKTIFYTTKDPQTLRSNKVVKHVIGTNQSDDIVVFEEKDETFYCSIYKTKSDAFLMIASNQTLSSEYRYLDANTPNDDWKIIQPREKGLEYSVDHYSDYFYIRTNLDAKNFKLVKTPISQTEKKHWVDVIPHRNNVYFQGMDIFNSYLASIERKDGLRTIRIISWDGKSDYYLNFSDPAYYASTTANVDFNTNILRYYYSSLTTPGSTIAYNMETKKKTVLKQNEVIDSTFKVDNYTSERLFATATDGTKIPVSLVYKNGIEKHGKNPLLLYAYGSYGNNSEPTFRSSRLSLLNRGFIFAIAHVRGGQEMGRDWYENGKLLKKKNTFTDFIDVGKFLVEKGYTNNEHMYANGGSAGGLLMGAIVNMEPNLWNGVVADVPFVDVVSTMLDESIPLTTFEFDEWGNPKNKNYYDYMKSYSPYDNVEAKSYPNILIKTGYWDSQVQYWEPAKWIAKLRALKTDNNLLIMDCNMKTGHGGASGRFARYKQLALTYAFIFDLENINK